MKNMKELTREQKEYIRFKLSQERMMEAFNQADKEGLINSCREFAPPKHLRHIGCDMTIGEIMFYERLEEMKKEHELSKK